MSESEERDEIVFLILFGGAYFIIFSQLAHVNEYYWVFALPFISIGIGSVSRAFQFFVTQEKTGKEVLTFGGVFVLVVLLTSYTLQVYQSSLDERSIERWNYTRDQAQIGREINLLLPKEEILIAGDGGYFLWYVRSTELLEFFQFYLEFTEILAFGSSTSDNRYFGMGS